MAKITDRKNILLMGGAGFLGSHLAESLVKDSNVICVDNFITSDQSNIENLLKEYNFAFIKQDTNQPLDLDKHKELEKFNVKFQGVQEVYNLACPTAPKDFEKNSVQTALSNSQGVINALNIAVKYKAKFMQFSSSVVYGPRTPEHKILSENSYLATDPTNPRACYDEGKRFAETLAETFKDYYKIDTKIARIFRTYGPKMQIFQGHMILEFILNAIDDKPLKIYGDENWSTSMCYVTDMIDGLIKFMATSENGPLNLGSPNEYKMSKIAKKIIEMTGSKSTIQYEQPLMFMSPLGLPDITAVKEKVGWFPVITLEKGLQNTIEFVKVSKILEPYRANNV